MLRNPIVSRLIGAACAGAASFVSSHDWKASALVALTFAIYGAAHKTTAQ